MIKLNMKNTFFALVAFLTAMPALNSAITRATQNLLDAIDDRNFEAALAAIGDGADVNYFPIKKKIPQASALLKAIINEAHDITLLLLEWNANPNTTASEIKTTPLHLAAHRGYLDTVKHLLSHGADLDAQNARKQTALTLAAMQGRTEVVRTLLERGAAQYPDDKNNTPLTYAAARGYNEIVALLLTFDAEADHIDSEGLSPIVEAAQSLHPEIVAQLIEHKALINPAQLSQLNDWNSPESTLKIEAHVIKYMLYLAMTLAQRNITQIERLLLLTQSATPSKLLMPSTAFSDYVKDIFNRLVFELEQRKAGVQPLSALCLAAAQTSPTIRKHSLIDPRKYWFSNIGDFVADYHAPIAEASSLPQEAEAEAEEAEPKRKREEAAHDAPAAKKRPIAMSLASRTQKKK
jgi:ankyrin repeat protein